MMVAAFVAYLSVMTVVDFARNGTGAEEKTVEPVKQSAFSAPTVRVTYCISWGYRNTFQSVRQNLEARHPGLSIEGTNHPATPLKLTLSNLTFFTRMGGLFILATGTKSFELFGAPVPEWYNSLQDNKMFSMIGLFFVGNMVEQSLLSTGAFEVVVNGEPVWSKIETGYLPSLEHLISLIDDKLGAKNEFNPNLQSLGGS